MSASNSSSINIERFQNQVAEAIDPAEPPQLSADSRFREVVSWDSMASVSLVAMVYAEYDVQISGEELVGCEVVGEVAALVESKISASGKDS